LRAHGLHAGHSTSIADRQHRFAVVEAVFKGFRPKQHGKRHGHGTHLQHRDVRHRRLKALRHDDGDPIPALDAMGLQHVGEPVGLALKLRVGIRHGMGRHMGCSETF